MRYQADATKLKRWREERNWSQEHLASLAGVGVRTIQRIENGDPTSADTLSALAAAYNVDVSSITSETPSSKGRVTRKNLAGLRFAFWIHFASYAFSMIVFLAIGVSSGDLFVMLEPALWWFVGLAGHGLAVAIVTLAFRYQQEHE